MTKAIWPAAERNKGPILDVLVRVLPPSGTLLEIASGSGQHAVHFAQHFSALTFQPSDRDPENLASIQAWVEEAQLPNLRAPLTIDVTSADWGVGQVEALFNANMLHIAPLECAMGLFAGIGRHVTNDGVAVLYGPYRIGGQHTAPSNAEFDESLRSRNPSWGVRDLEAVVAIAERVGFTLTERVSMPANNQTLVFRRG